MGKSDIPPAAPTLLAVVQGGRLEFEAALLALSLRAAAPDYPGKLVLAEPQPGPLWTGTDPRISTPEVRALLLDLGAEIRPFESRAFGASYPHGNKIEALSVLEPEVPFLFLDTDTLILDDPRRVPFDFDRPSASMKREGTWPQPQLYGPDYAAIWGALYDRFGLDFASSQDAGFPVNYWERYLYFNAGWFYGGDPARFGADFLRFATAIRDDPPPELDGQSLDPWLDQVALPLAIHAGGGGRPPFTGLLDGAVTCHWRLMPLLYARERDAVVETLERITAPNKVKKVLKLYAPFRKMIYQGKGHAVRALFDRANLPAKEQAIRNEIKRAKLWVR